jgi:hypothetical protein
MTERSMVGDPLPPGCRLIEVRVADPKQLFNAMDPSPFRDRDLDPNAEEFVVGWARELPADAPLALVVHLGRPGLPEEAALLRGTVSQFFAQRAETTRRRLRHLLGVGRVSLAIGLAFVAATMLSADVIAGALSGRISEIVRESLIIGGWVAMWRPLEIFLYDWWPIRREARLFDRLGAMPVRLEHEDHAASKPGT